MPLPSKVKPLKYASLTNPPLKLLISFDSIIPESVSNDAHSSFFDNSG